MTAPAGALTASLRMAVGRCLGSEVVDVMPVTRGGYSPARRVLCRLADDSTVFLKVATDDDTARWIRTEAHVYAHVAAPYMPPLLGVEDGEHVFLALADLSALHWPAPWRDGEVARVADVLDAVAATSPPPGLPLAADQLDLLEGWEMIGRSVHAFLDLGLCRSTWYDRHGAELAAAGASAQLGGNAFIHQDVRSDNVCFDDGRTFVVDWNWAAVGNPYIDRAFWAPSLTLETGCLPETVADAADPAFPAMLAGYWGWKAGLPNPPGTATTLKGLRRAQADVSLQWAARLMGVEPPR